MKRMERLIQYFIILFLCTARVYAQAPVISNIEPVEGHPNTRVVITGTGFGSNASALRVWFDHVQGSVVTATDLAIEVTVPVQARYQNVEVINLTTRLSAKSRVKFLSSYNGTTFDPTKFQSSIISSNTVPVFDICSCDMDLDGKPDLAGTKNVSGTDLVILHNKSTIGAVSFDRYDKANLAALNINQPTESITCGDLNGDGKPDLVATRGGTTANSFYVFRNTSTTTPDFATPIEIFTDPGQVSRQVFIRDLNGDGKPEIIVANSAASSILYVFENQSTGGNIAFNTANPVRVPVVGAPNTLALEIQDFDNDGRADIVATQNQGSNLFFLKNLSGTTISFAPAVVINAPGTFNDLSSGDFNKDGKLDLVVTSVFGTQSFVFLNKSTGGSNPFPSTPTVPAESITLITAGGPFGAEVEDINGDGFPDIIINNRGNTNISIFLHNKNTSSPGFTTAPINAGKNGWFSEVGDFDGDGKPDIVFTQAVTTGPNTVTILRNANCHQPLILNEAPIKICPGQTVDLEAIKLPGLTYEWKKDGSNFKGPGADAFASVTAAGSYTVTAVGETGTCTITSSVFVVDSGSGSIPTTAVINPITSACLGANLTINAVAQTGAAYLWKGPNGFNTETAVPQLVLSNITSGQAGIYTLQLRIGDCLGDEDSEQASVIEVGNFNVGSNVAGQVCQGTPVTLNVNTSSGRTYQWIKDGADVSGQTSATFAVTQPGAYKVRVSFGGCTKETDPFPVSFFSQPVANFTLPAAVCIGEELTFTNTSTVDNTATVTYTWNFGDGNTSTNQSPTYRYTTLPTQNPRLSIAYTGVTGCTSSVNKSITVNTATIPQITSDVSDLCPDDEAVLRVSDGFISFVWSNSETTQEIRVSQPGKFTVETRDANGCEGEANIEILPKVDCAEVPTVVPNMFSPNGDNQNDRWIITGENLDDCTLKVFDERGMRVYEKAGYDPVGWDGTFNGKVVTAGVYYYVFSCPDRKVKTGSVLIVK